MSNPDYFEHRTVPGDRWDTLAWHYYNDASKKNVIINANIHLFTDTIATLPALLPSGMELKIPVIEAPAIDEDLLPPWKRQDQ